MISLLFIIPGIKLIGIGGNHMSLPFLNELKHKQIKPLIFEGLNRKELIEDKELSYAKNLDTELAPAICPRKSAKVLKTMQGATDFLIVEGKQVYIQGTNFVYDGAVKGTVTSGKKAIVDFNGNLVIFPDKKYYDYIEDEFGTFTCPYDIEFTTVHYNRIFGIKGSNVYASKVGDFKVWDEYGGTQMDSWAADVYSDGDFTGITSYQDHVVFFKRDQMYELYGYTPSQFKIMESSKMGCIDDRSISEVAGMLMFVSEQGVQTYAGGFPREISDKLNIKGLSKAASIGDGRKYYVCVDKVVYIYDSWMGLWMAYMDVDVVQFAKSDNDIYALAADGKVYQLEAGTEIVEWEAITKEFDEQSFLKKKLRTIRLKVRMDDDAELSIYVSRDEKPFVLHKIVRQVDYYYRSNREIFVEIPLIRATNYQIKFVGKGRSVVYGEKEFVYGSDR